MDLVDYSQCCHIDNVDLAFDKRYRKLGYLHNVCYISVQFNNNVY